MYRSVGRSVDRSVRNAEKKEKCAVSKVSKSSNRNEKVNNTITNQLPLSFSLVVSLFPSRFCFSPRDFIVCVFFGLQKINLMRIKTDFCSGHLTCRFLGLIRHLLGRYTPLVMSWSIQKAYAPLACSRSSARRRIRRRSAAGEKSGSLFLAVARPPSLHAVRFSSSLVSSSPFPLLVGPPRAHLYTSFSRSVSRSLPLRCSRLLYLSLARSLSCLLPPSTV